MNIAEALRAARTPGRFYRARLWAEAHLAPREVAALAAQAETLPEPARLWARRPHADLLRAAPAPMPFERRAIGAHVARYALPPGADAAPLLLLVFGDRTQRPDIATALFLRHLPAGATEVLLLRDPSGAWVLRGVEGYAQDPAALAARLAAEVAPARQAGLVRLGVSGGGPAALALGQLLGARLAVSINGADPARARRRGDLAGATDGQEFQRLLAASGVAAGATAQLRVFSAARSFDPGNDVHLAAVFPGSRAAPIGGVATHSLIHALAGRGLLGRFPGGLLDGSFDPASWR